MSNFVINTKLRVTNCHEICRKNYASCNEKFELHIKLVPLYLCNYVLWYASHKENCRFGTKFGGYIMEND